MPGRVLLALVKGCRAGQAAAWDELLERYGKLIWSVTLHLGARQDEAEEVFQRTWVAIVEGIHSLRDPSRLAGWVATTARHQTYRLFAEQGRQRRLASLDESDSEAREAATTGDADTERLERVEQIAALHGAMDRLDPRCRELLELLFLRDPPMDYVTLSQHTGLAVGSIGPIRARCLARLGKAFHALYQSSAAKDR